ncbi:MAG: class I SAM-dependent methyltransferase [Bacteroidota bacterium]
MESNFECNLCGGVKANKVPFRYAFKDRFLWLMQCDNCGLRSIWPRPSDEEIVDMYASEYFTEADSKTHHMNDEYVKLLNEGDYASGVAEMKSYVSSGNILEIGCATGNFLYALKKGGFNVKGIELSEFAVTYAKQHFGIDIINQSFDDKLLGKGISENEFDIIIMGDVLEHFTNPTESMQLAHKILKPGGVVIIHLPGTLNLISSRLAFFLYKLIGTQKTMTIPPYHLTEFSAGTARKMCEMAGFSKIIIKQDVKHPNTIPLRGSFIENMVKKYLQYPNYYLTKWFGVDGDRISIEAFK